MPTYDNPRNGVVHWVETARPTITACHCLRVVPESKNYDPVGEPADVTCCHCCETEAWLDASQKEFEAAGGLMGDVDIERRTR